MQMAEDNILIYVHIKSIIYEFPQTLNQQNHEDDTVWGVLLTKPKTTTSSEEHPYLGRRGQGSPSSSS